MLDDISKVNLLHPMFLTNIRDNKGSFKILKNHKFLASKQYGRHAQIFKCISIQDSRISIFTKDGVYTLYKVTYNQGRDITVHMDDR